MAIGVVVIGAQTAGLSAAAQVRRKSPALPVTILDRGLFAGTPTCGLPWLLDGPRNASALARSPEALAEKYRFDIRLGLEAVGVEMARREVRCRRPDGREEAIPYLRLVIASGARSWVPPQVATGPRDRIFTLREAGDAAALGECLTARKPGSVAVLGAGLLGLEMVDVLRRRGLSVLLVEQAGQVLPGLAAPLAEQLAGLLAGEGVEVRLGTTVRAVRPGSGGLVLDLSDGTEVPAELLLCATGIRPNTEVFRELPLRFTPNGHLEVNHRMETGLDGIYAAGDCAAVPHLLHGRPMPGHSAVTAALTGRVAGENAAGFHAETPGILGAWSLKVFAAEAAAVGLTAAEAAAAGWPAVNIEVTVPTRPAYLSGPGPMRLSGTFRTDTGALLGCQVLGGEGAASSIQPVAALLRQRTDPESILQLEFPYTPPVGPLWHPLQQLARVAQKLIR